MIEKFLLSKKNLSFCCNFSAVDYIYTLFFEHTPISFSLSTSTSTSYSFILLDVYYIHITRYII